MKNSDSKRSRLPLELWAGLALMALLIVIAIFAPLFLQDRADEMVTPGLPGSMQHPLGTDGVGHDMLARTLVATRLSLMMAFGATAISALIGISVGAVAWFLPRRLRIAVLWVIDTMVAFPGLLLALVIAAIIGPGALSVVVAFGIAAAPSLARLTSNLGAQLSHTDFVATARGLGVPRFRLLTKHVVPNMAEPLLIVTASQFAQSLVSISALSFVGLGVQSPSYDFGKLLANALPGVFSGQLIQLLGPALMIVLTGLSGMLIGDGLAARQDPRLRQSTKALAKAKAKDLVEQLTPSAESLHLADAHLVVRDLNIISASGTQIVTDVNINVRKGEIVGIVGESGSGKSMTALAIAQLLPEGIHAAAKEMRAGALDLNGKCEPKELVESIALIYQDPMSTFNPALKLGTQMTEVMRVHRNMSRTEAKELAVESWRQVHITHPEMRLRQYPRELSGGMRQRVMIASALATDADLIIADEPTTALDVTVQAEILREIYRINKATGTSVLIISHDIGVVRELCDRVYVMQHGRVIEELAAGDLTESKVAHPYTRSLLRATPELSRAVTKTAGREDKI